VGPPALAVVVAYRGWESASSATPLRRTAAAR
jgi:hypothetical protein